jgi:hypothetical protein
MRYLRKSHHMLPLGSSSLDQCTDTNENNESWRDSFSLLVRSSSTDLTSRHAVVLDEDKPSSSTLTQGLKAKQRGRKEGTKYKCERQSFRREETKTPLLLDPDRSGQKLRGTCGSFRRQKEHPRAAQNTRRRRRCSACSTGGTLWFIQTRTCHPMVIFSSPPFPP